MSTDVRRRNRRRLLLAGVPLVLVASALQWKVAVMLVHDRDGRADYSAGSYDDALEAFASNGTLNLMESWISPFDAGTARYRLADFAGAVRSLEDALAAAPTEEECRVRINLALAHEAAGDEAVADGDKRLGLDEWQLALDVLQDGGCRGLLEDSARGVGSASIEQADDARTVDVRLRKKLRAQDTVAAAIAPAAKERADRLEERNEQAKRDRRKLEDKKQDQADAAPKDPADDKGEPPSYEW